MLAGIWRSALAQLAVAATLIVFLAFPADRFIGLAIDGMPSFGIIGALIGHAIVGVPVGLIHDAVGGSPVEAWIPKQPHPVPRLNTRLMPL